MDLLQVLQCQRAPASTIKQGDQYTSPLNRKNISELPQYLEAVANNRSEMLEGG